MGEGLEEGEFSDALETAKTVVEAYEEAEVVYEYYYVDEETETGDSTKIPSRQPTRSKASLILLPHCDASAVAAVGAAFVVAAISIVAAAIRSRERMAMQHARHTLSTAMRCTKSSLNLIFLN